MQKNVARLRDRKEKYSKRYMFGDNYIATLAGFIQEIDGGRVRCEIMQVLQRTRDRFSKVSNDAAGCGIGKKGQTYYYALPFEALHLGLEAWVSRIGDLVTKYFAHGIS